MRCLFFGLITYSDLGMAFHFIAFLIALFCNMEGIRKFIPVFFYLIGIYFFKKNEREDASKKDEIGTKNKTGKENNNVEEGRLLEEELTLDKIKTYVKKFEFILSYILKNSESNSEFSNLLKQMKKH